MAPGAEEAFKSEPIVHPPFLEVSPRLTHGSIVVSKAFQVLSDPNKRTIYDQTGGDPDSRGGGGGGGGGFARRPAGAGFQGGFQGDDVSPEELFRMFFGQGAGGFGGGGPFGGGGGFGGGPFGGASTFQFFGPGGVRMGTGMPRQAGMAGGAGGRAGPQGSSSTWIQLAPLFFLLALSFLTQLPSLFSSPDSVDPDFSFDKTSSFSVPRTTSSGVQYYVSPEQFAQHPLYESILSLNPALGFSSEHPPKSARYRRDLVEHLRKSAATASPVNSAPAEGAAESAAKQAQTPPNLKVPPRLRTFEKNVESAWVNRLHAYCRHEVS